MDNNQMTEVLIREDEQFITLGQLLKKENIVSSGGQVKIFLLEVEVLLNGEIVNQRGKKLYENDIIEIPEVGKFIIKK